MRGGGEPAENLSPKEFQERERLQEILRQGVIRWAETQKLTERFLSKSRLAELVKFLHENYPEALYGIADGLIDRTKYIERPCVPIYLADPQGPIDVDVFLLGWRTKKPGEQETSGEPKEIPKEIAEPDGTYIHDHEATEVGIEVLDYDPVTEIIFITDQTKTAAEPQEKKQYLDPHTPENTRSSEYEELERQFGPRSNIAVGAPYIHQFRGPKEMMRHGMAVTLHAYSTDPQTIPMHCIPEEIRDSLKTTGLYKMNYFRRTVNARGQNMLSHAGYYAMFTGTDGHTNLYINGEVEGVTEKEAMPQQKCEFMYC